MLLNFDHILIFFTGVIIIWLTALTVLFYNFHISLRKLTKGVAKKDLKTILKKLLKDFDKQGGEIKDLIKVVEELKKDNLYNIHKVGLVRYNPFAETGGDQSFCLSLLDGSDSGLVISSLHSRDTTRIYAKPVKKGKAAGYDLSAEEKQAIKKAKKIR
ncbi:hypothetical protein AMJ51_01710 [Microgenomates bacterium DG_75]|nr:MAG: hypothetical protein AMJ51_01710 [Microgenomates bacterium DG_75]